MADPRSIADDLLFPGAGDVERGIVPVAARLDVLAAAGLYGLHVPSALGGLGVDTATAHATVEALASGCLTTTFVWIQHQGVVKRVVAAGGALAEEVLPAMASGEVRAGVAVGGIRQPSPTLHAREVGGTWVLDGTVPWISGWGMVDVVLVAALVGGRVEEGIAWLLVDAPQPLDGPDGTLELGVDSLVLDRHRLVALDRTASARATFRGHAVPADRLLRRQGYPEWLALDEAGLRTNGSLPLGLAGRCADLAGASDVAAAVDRVRARLDAADVAGLPAARAAASALAWEAAARLLADRGGRSVAAGDPAERLAREAMVLQVFGTRPSITDAVRQASAARVADIG